MTKHKTCRFLICAPALRQSRSWYSITAQQRCFARPHNQLCSPLFDELAPGLQMTELCPHPKEQYQAFRRTTLKMRGELEQSQLGAELAAQEQVLCIVNRSKTAQELYNNLPKEGSYCLTTLLYPAHRKQLLQEIRERLKDGLPCRVISTSLIEAGVDVDFPAVYREEAGLDSILQAAGRCNREGRRPAEQSLVQIFYIGRAACTAHAGTECIRNAKRPEKICRSGISGSNRNILSVLPYLKRR